MYCPDPTMKINKFVQVEIPKNSDYMARLGRIQAPPNQYSGDEPAPQEQRKTDDIELYRQWAEEQANKTHSQE